MLVRLYGRNFRSLKDPFELSMVAADLTSPDERDRGLVDVEIQGARKPLTLLRTAALYGPNGSGKSTVLTAAKAIQWMVKHSSRMALPNGPIPPYEPFSLDRDSRSAPVTLGCDTVHDKSILRYTVTYTRSLIEHESLTLIDEQKEQPLFARDGKGSTVGTLISKRGSNRFYVKDMQPNVSVLSKLAHHGPSRGRESIRPYYDTICRYTSYKDYSTSAARDRPIELPFRPGHEERFGEDPAYKQWIMKHIMTVADIGISDAETQVQKLEIDPRIRKQIEEDLDAGAIPTERTAVTFTHKGRTPGPIDFEYESAGTRKLFTLSGDWWRLSHDAVALIADELSASLHPLLLDRLIRAVNDLPRVGVRSQLIFTTHDNGLLESRDGLPPALRRDQVYLTEKNANGESQIYPLTDFKDDARSAHNLRKRYLSGLFGALPSVDGVSL